jgi:hypothetical protein
MNRRCRMPDSSSSPYAPPAQASPPVWPTGDAPCYRDGADLLVREDATLPPCCPFTGQPAALDCRLTPLRIIWAPRGLIPAALLALGISYIARHYKWEIAGTLGILAPLISLLFPFLRKECRIHAFLSPEFRRTQRRVHRIAATCVLVGISAIFMPLAFGIFHIGGGIQNVSAYQESGLLLSILGVAYSFSAKRLRFKQLHNGWLRLRGCSPVFLATLPAAGSFSDSGQL